MTQTDFTATPPARQSRSLRSLLLIVALAFAAGLGLTIWGLSQSDFARNLLLGGPGPAPATVLTAPPPTLPAPTVSTDLAARLAALEGRVAAVEANGGSGSGAARAEGLLIAFAARRALDRGLELGYVEGLLNQHFGATQPRAVATVIAASRRPATIEQLRSGLEAARPALAGARPDQSWWDQIRSGLASLFIVRRAETASPVPDIRVAQAQRYVEAGRVDLALAEIARLPTRDRAADWLAMARRHVEAHRALDLLEAAAITDSPPLPRADNDEAAI